MKNNSKKAKPRMIDRSEIAYGIRGFWKAVTAKDEKFEAVNHSGRSWNLPKRTFKMLIYICLSSVLIGHLFLLLVNISRYERYVEEIRAKGEPALPSDIEIKQIPDDQNGAIYLHDAIENHYIDFYDYTEILDAIKLPYIELDFNLNSFTVSSLKKSSFERRVLRGWIDKNKKCFELIKQAESCPQAKFRLNFDISSGCCPDSSENNFYSLIELLMCSLNLSIAERNKLKALEHFKTLTDFSMIFKDQLNLELFSEVYMINVYSKEILYQAVENIELTPDEIDYLFECHLNTFEAMNMRSYILSLRYEYLHETDRLNKFLYSRSSLNLRFIDDFPVPMYYLISEHVSISDVLLHIVRFQTELLELVDKPYFQIKDDLDRLAGEFNFGDLFQNTIFTFSGIEELRRYYNEQVQNAVIYTTLAVKKFEILYKRKPQSLDELVKAGIINSIPKNPLTGKDLDYEVIKGKYRVFTPQSNDVLNKLAHGYKADQLVYKINDDIEWKSYGE